MYAIDSTGGIKLPRGDTLLFTVRLATDGRPALLPDGTAVVFGIYDRAYQRNVFSRVFPIEDGLVVIRLANADTRGIRPGNYFWDLRIVTNPEYDADGNVVCDDISDDVFSVFSGGPGMPPFILTEVAASV